MAAAGKQTREKQERVIEAVRRGLEGPAAVEFIHNSGYAITQAGIARHLRTLGGRGRIQELIAQGNSNREVLLACVPDAELPPALGAIIPPSQEELFTAEGALDSPFPDDERPLYDTVKLTVTLPSDVYEAVKLASRAEHKKQNDLIVEILTAHLARTPNIERHG